MWPAPVSCQHRGFIHLEPCMSLASFPCFRAGLVSSLLATLLTVGAATAAQAQRAELTADRLPYRWSSEAQTTPARGGVLASHLVRREGAQWLRLRFDAVELAPGSVLRITSLQDGARQHLSATTAAQWRQTSAYFNGPAVRVELLAAEGSVGNRVGIDQVTAGRPALGTESQCGPTDDRVASNTDNRARVVDVGCTANLTADGCFITAGHCMVSAGDIDVVEFNVPLSNANGSIVHPTPADQYMPTGNRQSTSGGIGNDWGVFTVFANTETGLTPLQAQGPGLEFSTVTPRRRNLVEITGYGVDSGSANQTQQVSSGAVTQANASTSTLKYRADTEGGNSGSAVLVGGLVVAIHTNGGCRTNNLGANSGTLTSNAAFQTAYANVCGAPVFR
jgi:V8-like Glu-specific endopeptidase